MDFSPEVEYEVIRDAVSHKLYRPLIYLSHKVWIESTQIKIITSLFQIGDSLGYINEGHNYMVELVDINTNDPRSTNYSIKFLSENTEQQGGDDG